MGHRDYQGTPVAAGVRGTIGKAVTYRVHKGKQVSYPYVSPTNPDTPAQRHQRGILRLAMWAWAAFTEEQKEALEMAAKQRHFYSGFLTHMSEYMRGYIAWLEDL
jgi:hypothetical protein